MGPADRMLVLLALAAATGWTAGGVLVDLAAAMVERLRRRRLV